MLTSDWICLRVLSVLACCALGASSACSDEDICIPANADCAPLYEPTFDNVFAETLQPRCGVPGVACHAREGAHGGLVFADPDEAYAQLTGQDGNSARIDVDNPGCGVLLRRLFSTDPSFQMPPSSPLDDAELCSVTQWVVMGATR